LIPMQEIQVVALRNSEIVTVNDGLTTPSHVHQHAILKHAYGAPLN